MTDGEGEEKNRAELNHAQREVAGSQMNVLPSTTNEESTPDLARSCYRSSTCDVPRLDVLSTASLCPAIFVVDLRYLFYLLTVVMNFVGWYIFR